MSEAPREASASGSAGDVGVRDSMRSWLQVFSGLGLTCPWRFKNGPEEFRVSGFGLWGLGFPDGWRRLPCIEVTIMLPFYGEKRTKSAKREPSGQINKQQFRVS